MDLVLPVLSSGHGVMELDTKVIHAFDMSLVDEVGPSKEFEKVDKVILLALWVSCSPSPTELCKPPFFRR